MFNAKEVCQKLNDFDHKFEKLTERFGLSGQNCSTTVINGVACAF